MDLGSASIGSYLKLFEQYTNRIQWVLLTSLVLGGILASKVYVWHFGYQDALHQKYDAQLVQVCTQTQGPKPCDPDYLAAAVRLGEEEAAASYSAVTPEKREASGDGWYGPGIQWFSGLDDGRHREVLQFVRGRENAQAPSTEDRLPVLGVNVSDFDLIPISGIFLVILYAWLLGLVEHLRVLTGDLAQRLTKSDLLRDAETEDQLVVTRSLPALLVLFWPSSRRSAYLQSALVYFAVACLGLALVSDAVDIFALRHFPLRNEASVWSQVANLNDTDHRRSYVIGLVVKEVASLAACSVCWFLGRGAIRRIREVVGMVAVLRWSSHFRSAIEAVSRGAHDGLYGDPKPGSTPPRTRPVLAAVEKGLNDISFAPKPGREGARWPLHLVLNYSVGEEGDGEFHTVTCVSDADFSRNLPSLMAGSDTVTEYFRKHLEPTPGAGPLREALNAKFRHFSWPS